MRCAYCNEEHASVMLAPACHPSKPLHVSAAQHPDDPDLWTLEMRCSKCGKHVAYFTAKRVLVN